MSELCHRQIIRQQQIMKKSALTVLIALLRKVFLLVPLALLLPHFWGMKGVFLAESISDATAAICCTLIFAYQFPRILAHMKTPKAA